MNCVSKKLHVQQKDPSLKVSFLMKRPSLSAQDYTRVFSEPTPKNDSAILSDTGTQSSRKEQSQLKHTVTVKIARAKDLPIVRGSFAQNQFCDEECTTHCSLLLTIIKTHPNRSGLQKNFNRNTLKIIRAILSNYKNKLS